MLGVLLALGLPSLTSLGSSSPGHAGSPRMCCASCPFLPQVKGTVTLGSPLCTRRSCRFWDPFSLLPWAAFQFAQDEGMPGCLSHHSGASKAALLPSLPPTDVGSLETPEAAAALLLQLEITVWFPSVAPQ